jgi:signal transduction histidine kinase
MTKGSAAPKRVVDPRNSWETTDSSLRDVVALATLPAIWTGAEPLRIAESLAASLFTMLNPEFVYVSIVISDSSAPVAVTQTGRYETDEALAKQIGPAVFDWAHAHDPDDLLTLELPGRADAVLAATRSIGLNAELGAIAAGFAAGYRLKPNDLLLLNVAATQAAIAAQNAKLLHSLRASELRANQAVEELRNANTNLEHFAYAASHDLQEPLRTVMSYTQLLAREFKGNLGSRADQFIGYVVDGALRMEMLLKGLRDYWAVNEEKVDRRVPTDSGHALQEALYVLNARIQESGAVITRDPLPVVAAEELPFVLLFQNLVGNALKYVRDGEQPQVHVSVKNSDGQWHFSVRDNGVGIDSKYLETIFAPFKRLHGTSHPGSGLGLAICQRIVQRYKGRIWAESAGGEGSTFHFTIPQ